jgi:hypothetical protein
MTNKLNKTNRQYNYTISEQPTVIVRIRYEISLFSAYSNDLLRWLHSFTMMNHMVLLL